MDTGQRRLRHQSERSRRAQYVNQACNGRKRRKIRCNGAQPCRRCGVQLVPCIYSNDSQDRGQEHVSTTSASSVELPAASTSPATTSLNHNAFTEIPVRSDQVTRREQDSIQPQPLGDMSAESPEFCGPSSSEFTLNVVSGNLKAMGMPAAILEKSFPGAENESRQSSRLAHYGPFMKLLTMDPLWDIKKADALDLVNKWFDSIGSVYPVLERDGMLNTAETVFTALESLQRDGVKLRKASVAETLFSDETNKMKIILAVGRTIQGGGRNDQAQRLFQSITEAVEGLIWNSDGINGIQLLVLVALYHYHLDEEVRTGRIVGFAARLCLEMGLHRRIMVERLFPNLRERSIALRTFWSVYMLERRTSLGLGIPFSLQDSHIDPALFAYSDPNPMLSYLIEWTKLAGQIWQALNSHGEKGVEIKPDTLSYLDYQAVQWYEQLPDNLKLNTTWLQSTRDGSRVQYGQVVLFTRKSHLRNLIYRPVLQSASRIKQHEGLATIAVNIAKGTIQTLGALNEKTTLVQFEPVFFKHLWLTAFGNLLLAVVNSNPGIWESVRAEFDMGLNWIKLLSHRSAPLMHLWQRLQGLRELQAQILHQRGANVAEGYTTGPENPTPEALSLNELFPAAPTGLAQSDVPLDWTQDFSRNPMVRDQVNSLFDASIGPCTIFDFPYIEWEGHYHTADQDSQNYQEN